jgi:dTDP-4-amino-4,6-dideoxygalactose transaminase
VTQTGAKVVFCDVDPFAYTIDVVADRLGLTKLAELDAAYADHN